MAGGGGVHCSVKVAADTLMLTKFTMKRDVKLFTYCDLQPKIFAGQKFCQAQHIAEVHIRWNKVSPLW